MKQITLAFGLLLIAVSAFGQYYFSYDNSIEVSNGVTTIDNPWAGGLNFVQISEIDLNNDGKQDLFVFDRSGSRITTYINEGSLGTIKYRYAPSYAKRFPTLTNWAILRDFNCDGKADIITNNTDNKVAIYLNTSSSSLSFELYISELRSNYGSGFNPLKIRPTDVPSVSDIDNDGDLDIITFDFFSSGTVEYHQNQTIENFGNCDTILFEMVDGCWGRFKENATTNMVDLGITCKTGDAPESGDGDGVHANSTLLGVDLDGDGDEEMIIGDGNFDKLTMLVNGGDEMLADMVSQDINFPNYDVTAVAPTLPASFLADVNNDGRSDLIVSGNAENQSGNFENTWLYLDASTTSAKTFDFQQNNFLVDNMIDVGEGAFPILRDYNGDGLMDLFVANTGYYTNGTDYPSYISLYENTGTISAPAFTLLTDDFESVSSINKMQAVPTFGDLDGDGDDDMLIGTLNGDLQYFENSAGAGNPMNMSITTVNYMGIDVGNAAVPQLIDVNRDGLLDLIIGEKSGNINYYENTGSVSIPSYTLVNATFGDVYVTPPAGLGYSTPYMFEDEGEYKLAVGSEDGQIHLYDNIDGNLSGTFNLVDSTLDNIDNCSRSAPFIYDLTNDGKLDILYGMYSGGIVFEKGVDMPTAIEQVSKEIDFTIYPNPVAGDLTINVAESGNYSVTIFSQSGKLVFESDFANSLDVEMDELAKGIYFIRVTGSKSSVVRRVIKL